MPMLEIEGGILKKYIPDQKNASITIEENVTKIGRNAFTGTDIKSVSLPGTVKYLDFGALQNCSELEEVIISDGLEEVHNFIFAGCSNLKHVVLPNTLKFIGKWMFKDCFELETITLPDSITSIGDNAFEGCKKLKQISIPNNVRDIGEYAFLNCTALERVTIGSGLSHISNGVFACCDLLKGVQIDPENRTFQSIDGVIFKNDGITLKLAVPGLTGHYSVPEGTQAIDDGAFEGCRKITSVHFPKSLKSIGFSAFFDCDGLNEVVIPANISSIGFWAFGKREHWNSPAPKRLERISVNPAAGSVYIGKDVFYLGGTDPLIYPELPIIFVSDKDQKRRLALGFCLHPEMYSGEYEKGYLKYVKGQRKSILEVAKKLNLPEVEDFYKQLDAANPAKETNKPEQQKTKIALPGFDTVSSPIEDFLIQDNTLVKYLGAEARIAIPEVIQKIEANAFSDCKTIEEIIVPGTVATIGEKVFYGCKKLQKVVFEDGVKIIEKKSFSKCPKLRTVIILSSEVSIQFDFYKFKPTIAVVLPNASPGAISASNRMQSVISTAEAWNSGVINEFDPKGKYISYVKRAAHQLFPIAETNDAVLRLLLEYKLASRANIEDALTLWKTQSAERRAMLLEYANSTKTRGVKKPVSGDEFEGKALTITEAKQDWSYDTMVWDKSVTKTEFVKGITIKKYKGYKPNVEVPSFIGKLPVCRIERAAFANNQTVRHVIIPPSVFEIGAAVFGKCHNLNRVEIQGEKVSTSWYVFLDCDNLEEVVLRSKEVTFGRHPFLNCEKMMDSSGFVILNVEGEKILCDCQSPILCEELIVPEGVTRIDGCAFSRIVNDGFVQPPKNKLRKIVLPSTLKEIGECAFEDDDTLEEVVIQDGLETIGELAFEDCTQLKDVFLPESISSFGGSVFRRCENLTIHCVSGSAAERYALDNGLSFIAE